MFQFNSSSLLHVRTSYIHQQEDYTLHAALYAMLFMHLCKQSGMLKDYLDTK